MLTAAMEYRGFGSKARSVGRRHRGPVGRRRSDRVKPLLTKKEGVIGRREEVT